MEWTDQEVLTALQNIPTFAEVPEDQLSWMMNCGLVRKVETGEQIFKPGAAADYMTIVLEGIIDVYVIQNGDYRHVTKISKNEITGVLPYSRLKTVGGYGEVKELTYLLQVHRDCFRDMIQNHYELTSSLVHHMTTRVREFTKFQQQNEKMMSLGKLSAGLAHELNNPAAAVVRSAEALKSHLGHQPEKFKKVMGANVSAADVDFVNQYINARLDEGLSTQLTMMERSDREDELLDWLDDHDIEGSDEIAETLVEFGVVVDDLDEIADNIAATSLNPFINWINSVMSTEKMVLEIGEASQRIAGLVSSIKSYTHMDRGQDSQTFDVTEGINNTLTMLNHKLKKGNVKVVQEYDKSHPTIMGKPGELNQVWTNVIDNALDAMSNQEEQSLTIRTVRDDRFVKVYIIDSGPGIPEDIQSQIFDPFFTTKELGKGTGLGLDVVQRIVKQHKGIVQLNSEAGRTEFLLCFPAAS